MSSCGSAERSATTRTASADPAAGADATRLDNAGCVAMASGMGSFDSVATTRPASVK
jgi:hypothetical protein